MSDYALEDLVRLSGYSARGIRHYIQRGLLVRPKLAGRSTRYERGTLGRLAAIRTWRDKDGISVRRIKRLLRALPPEELEDWADTLDPTEEDDGSPEAALTPLGPATESVPLVTAERWLRVPVAPGLDLVLRDGAGEEIVQMAQEIQRRYAQVG